MEPLSAEELGRCLKERRIMITILDERDLILMLNRWKYPTMAVAIDCLDLPDNAYVLGCFYSDCIRGWHVQFAHPSFGPTAANCQFKILGACQIVIMDGEIDGIHPLLEQHDSYDLGDGWSLGTRQPGEWCVYYQAKHVDCWKAQFYGEQFPQDDCLTTYSTAASAFAAWKGIIRSSDWAQLNESSKAN